MNNRQISQGTFVYCKGNFAKRGIARHLQAGHDRKETIRKLEATKAGYVYFVNTW